MRQEDHPFLEVQQAGFSMLARKLSGIRQRVWHVNTRLSRLEMLLRPLGRIADNVGRLADAVERLVPATPPPPSTRSPPITRSTRTTLCPAAPGTSRGQSHCPPACEPEEEEDNTTYIFTSNPSIICVLLYFFLGTLSVVTICGNFLVIISIIYFKQLHIPTNYLILSLAVADLLVGVLVFPFSMAFTVTWCWYHEGLFYRYYAVCKPLAYKSKINDHIIRIMILVCWGIAALIGIGIIIAGFNQGKCEESCLIDALISTTLACIFSFYVPVIIMLSIYLKIFLVAQEQARSIQNTTCQSKKSGATVSKNERKATKTLAIVLGVFLLCWSPYFLCIIFQPLTYNVTPIAVIETLNWLTLLNSMLNPFIYAFFYSWFRSAFRMIISGKIFQGHFANSKLL
ncbi:trace amine-associated receptor 1-like [Sander lucioperca]|uniref:trace amine-associated receptor 1-like n=1 Tax=Sander lucioperca TaxID=283035 RepID=UPI00125CD5E1|nr:trace amine-associated receptor 1-like [Sander lucioperca]